MKQQWGEKVLSRKRGHTEDILVFVVRDFLARAVGIGIWCFGGCSGMACHESVVIADDDGTESGEQDVAIWHFCLVALLWRLGRGKSVEGSRMGVHRIGEILPVFFGDGNGRCHFVGE